MTTTKRNIYTIKLIDEFGNCYHEENIVGYIERQKYIKEWLAGLTHSYVQVGDITVVIKTTGEELWYYGAEDTTL